MSILRGTLPFYCSYYSVVFGNTSISSRLREVYGAQYSHDRSMRRVQNTFFEIFASEEFFDLLTAEIGKTMTEMVNKLFIAV
ncbi:hypothetical protein BBD42_03665 [Paenibacillus sp. BIHB 4019]|uniref:Uncharacterized protein n=1 Tax=Paenibacillus sp. BIHB 4019 TaxID=1870819 RepID=A0A1B2DD89_9BACL|nr:hypothetical protein BBD42_03665 [Paenibacillus sp. BIHB 4019]